MVIRYVDSSHGPCTYSITLAIQSIALRSLEQRSAAEVAPTPEAAAVDEGERRRNEDVSSAPFRKVC